MQSTGVSTRRHGRERRGDETIHRADARRTRWPEDLRHGLTEGSVALVLGTRPEIVKLAGIADVLGPAARIVHTGQHYDDALGGTFFRQFGMTAPAITLEVGGLHRGEQIGHAVTRITRHLLEQPAQAILVQGDTNAALAGALAANSIGTPLVHIEAGLRSHDRQMPEEHNRVLIDHLSDLCCAPTPASAANLLYEAIPLERVGITGNTVVEAVHRLLPPAAERRALLDGLELRAGGYAVATIHRPENTDDPARLSVILRELQRLPVPVLFPLHPRTAARIETWGLGPLLDGLRVVGPAGYQEFLALAAESAVLVSDSGGLQEEASVLKRPIAVVRTSTERPEVLGTFAALVAPDELGPTVRSWLEDLDAVHARLAELPSPYGDGSASTRCVEEVMRLVGDTTSAPAPAPR
jgi:UDP-N-acetylglucosamine 2-epimerase (non-hydrolysing)